MENQKNSTPMEIFNKAVLERKATWWQMNLPDGAVVFGDAKTEMLGYNESDFKTYKDFTILLHTDDYETAMQAMRDHLEGKKDFYETVYRIKHKDGHYLKFYDCGQIIEKKGDNITVMGFVWSVENEENIKDQIEKIKKTVLVGNPSMIDLVKGIKETRFSF